MRLWVKGLSTGHPLTRGQAQRMPQEGCVLWAGEGFVVPGQTQKKAKQQGEQSVKINIKACWPCPAFVA